MTQAADTTTRFAQALAMPVPSIPLEPIPGDFGRLATHVALILSAAKERVTALLEEARHNDPSSTFKELDLVKSADAYFSDLSGDIEGACRIVDEHLAWFAPRRRA